MIFSGATFKRGREHVLVSLVVVLLHFISISNHISMSSSSIIIIIIVSLCVAWRRCLGGRRSHARDRHQKSTAMTSCIMTFYKLFIKQENTQNPLYMVDVWSKQIVVRPDGAM